MNDVRRMYAKKLLKVSKSARGDKECMPNGTPKGPSFWDVDI